MAKSLENIVWVAPWAVLDFSGTYAQFWMELR